MEMTLARRIFALSVVAIFATPLLAADISGRWNMVWDTEGGVRRTVWDVRQAGEKVTVETDGSKLEGTVNGNEFSVAGKFYSAEAGYSSDLKVSGSLEGAQLKGKGSWDQYGMTFTATKAE